MTLFKNYIKDELHIDDSALNIIIESENFTETIFKITFNSLSEDELIESLNKIFDNFPNTIDYSVSQSLTEDFDDIDDSKPLINDLINKAINVLYIKATKQTNRFVFVFCKDLFVEYLNSLDLKVSASRFSQYLKRYIDVNQKFTIYMYDINMSYTNDVIQIESFNFSDSKNPTPELIQDEYIIKRGLISSTLNETSSTEFSKSNTIYPLDFYFCGPTDEIKKYFNQLCTYISISLLSNRSYVDNNHKFYFGNHLIDISKNDFIKLYNSDYTASWIDTFDWIYEIPIDNERLKTKLMIFRDYYGSKVMSGSLNLAMNDIIAIQESYNMFILGHTKQFLQAKSQLSNSINSIIDQLEKVYSEYVDSFKKSMFSAFNFTFITVGLQLLSSNANKTFLNSISFANIIILIVIGLYVHMLAMRYEFRKKISILSLRIESVKEYHDGYISKSNLDKIISDLKSNNPVLKEYHHLYSIYMIVWSILLFLISIAITYYFSTHIDRMYCSYLIVPLLMLFIDVTIYFINKVKPLEI